MKKTAFSKSSESSPVCVFEDILEIENRDPGLPGSDISTYEFLSRSMSSASGLALSFFLRSQDFKKPFTWEFGEWLSCITQAANMFRDLGLQRGDVVAFVLPNLPETHWTIWGGEAAGVAFAINPLLEAPMVLDLLNAAKPKLVVTLAPAPGTDLWEKVSSILPRVTSVEAVLTVSPFRYLRGVAGAIMRGLYWLKTPRRVGRVQVLDFHSRLRLATGSALNFEPPVGSDVASYFCTGGTTGTPKIAIRSHRTEVANAMQLSAIVAGSDKSREAVLCGLPLFHVNAQIATGLVPWSAGRCVVLATPQGYRAPGLIQNFWTIVEHYRLAWFSGVPTLYSALLNVPRGNCDISSLRFGVCGAAPMPKELLTNFQRETGIKILEGYGLTEGGCVSSLNPMGGECRAGSIGLRLPWQGMRAVLTSDTGVYLRDAAVGEVGVIVIKGPNLFKGYLNPIHNQGIWLEIPGKDGLPEVWLNTGDLGCVDAQGYFWLTGRAKELIIRGGHNIDPKMIEEPMHAHPAVAMAAAIGRPDVHAGEVPVLYVQLRSGSSASVDELLDYARHVVAEQAAVPKRIYLLPSLPTTAVGKIFKPALTMAELESVVMEEATACGLSMSYCKAIQDPKKGYVVKWSVDGDPEPLVSRLGKYSFSNEMVRPISNA